MAKHFESPFIDSIFNEGHDKSKPSLSPADQIMGHESAPTDLLSTSPFMDAIQKPDKSVSNAGTSGHRNEK